MDQTAVFSTVEGSLADSLMARVAALAHESDSKFDLIEKLDKELGLSSATLYWHCGKYERIQADKAGEHSCRPRRGNEVHRAAKWGCGYRILLPAKIS